MPLDASSSGIARSGIVMPARIASPSFAMSAFGSRETKWLIAFSPTQIATLDSMGSRRWARFGGSPQEREAAHQRESVGTHRAARRLRHVAACVRLLALAQL